MQLSTIDKINDLYRLPIFLIECLWLMLCGIFLTLPLLFVVEILYFLKDSVMINDSSIHTDPEEWIKETEPSKPVISIS